DASVRAHLGYEDFSVIGSEAGGQECADRRHTRACQDSRIKFVLYDVRHTSLTRLGCSGCDTWTFARIAGHSKIQMSTRYVHSQRMEGSGWRGQWFAARSAQRISVQAEAEQAQPPR